METRKARKNGGPGYKFVERIEDHGVGHFSFENNYVGFFIIGFSSHVNESW